jgi:hypothetical protein
VFHIDAKHPQAFLSIGDEMSYTSEVFHIHLLNQKLAYCYREMMRMSLVVRPLVVGVQPIDKIVKVGVDHLPGARPRNGMLGAERGRQFQPGLAGSRSAKGFTPSQLS